MSEKKIEIKGEVQLLVEGKDAANFFMKLSQHVDRSDVDVHDFGGVDELRGFLAAFVAAPNFDRVRSIGVVRDAEESADGALQSVRDALQGVNLSVSRQRTEQEEGSVAVCVLILPGGEQPGMLETLLCRTITDDPVDRCIDDFLSCAERQGAAVRSPDKARVHAWLATRPAPHVSAGVAALKGYWNLDHVALEGVRRFVADL